MYLLQLKLDHRSGWLRSVLMLSSGSAGLVLVGMGLVKVVIGANNVAS